MTGRIVTEQLAGGAQTSAAGTELEWRAKVAASGALRCSAVAFVTQGIDAMAVAISRMLRVIAGESDARALFALVPIHAGA